MLCLLAIPISVSSVGHTDGFGAWKLVPIILVTPLVMLTLIIWGLVARSRSTDSIYRSTALFFSACALAVVALGAFYVFTQN